MNKSIALSVFIVLALFNSVQSQNANANVCAILTGVWTQAGLSAPTAICQCFDATTSQNLLTLIGEVLQEASSGSLSVLTKIEQQVEAFVASIPASDKECLNGTAPQQEAQQIEQALNIAGMTPQQIESKIESYAVFHLSALIADVKNMNTAFAANSFTSVGTQACQVAQAIFGSADEILKLVGDANANVCAILTGVWSQAGLSAPTAICQCFDPTTSQNLLTLIGEVLSEASSGSLSVLTKIEQQVEAFAASIPASDKECLNGTAPQQEAQQIEQALNIAGMTPQQIESKIESYAVFHLSALIADVKNMNAAFDGEQFTSVGTQACQVAQAIFGSDDVMLELVGDANADVCAILTGVWTQAKLSSPTAICSCFDPTTSQNLLTLIGEVLQEASSGSLSVLTKIEQQVEAFVASIPASDKECLNGTAPQQEAQQIEQALNIAGMTPQQIESKIESYAVFHLSALIADVKNMNTAFAANSFTSVGTQACQVAQAIFGSSSEQPLKRSYVSDANANVCALITGVWTQAGLSAPTVICSCWDETTSQNLLNTLGEVLQEASSGSLSVLSKIEQQVEAFVQSIPQADITCLNSTASMAEVNQAEQAYNVAGLSTQQIESKIESYAVFHLAALVADVKTMTQEFDAEEFSQVGQSAGAVAQQIF